MHSIRNFRLAALGAVALFGASTLVMAQPPVGARGQGTMQQGARGDRAQQRGVGQRGFGGQLLKGITLTADQQAQLKALREKQAASRPDSGRRGNGAQQGGGAPRVRPDSATMVRMRAEREAQFAAQIAELRNILTAEQRVVFDQNVKTAREQMASRGGRGGQRGGERGGKGEHHPRNDAARGVSARR